MLIELLKAKMKDEDLSTRQAAAQSGISHTTIARMLNGDKMDMSTLLRLSKWLNVDPSQAINLLSQDPDWKTSFEVLIRHEPALAELFKRIVADYEKGLLTVSDITDIIQYANYKLTTKEQSKAK